MTKKLTQLVEEKQFIITKKGDEYEAFHQPTRLSVLARSKQEARQMLCKLLESCSGFEEKKP